jgi:hypothetical protein
MKQITRIVSKEQCSTRDKEPNSCVSETQCSNNRDKDECKEWHFVASETFPDCWTEKQYMYFIPENSWVEVKDKMLGCSVCGEVSEVGMGEQKGAGVHFAKDNMNAKYVETTIRVFRTVYKVAKQNRPFTDLPLDIELQELNGLNMGRVLHSNFSC